MNCVVKILTTVVLSSALCGTGYALTQNDAEVDNTVVSESKSDSNSANETVEIKAESEKPTSSSSKVSETSSTEKEVSEVREEINSVIIHSDEESGDIIVDDCETMESDNMDEKIYEKPEYDEEVIFDEGEYTEIEIYESPVYDAEEEPVDGEIVGIRESAYDG